MARESRPRRPAPPESSGRGSVVFRVLDLMQLVAAADRPLSAAEIGRKLDLPKPTAHRLCLRPEQEAYLLREPDRRQFRAGPAAERLAFNIVRRNLVSTERHAILQSLVRDIGETCNFTAPAGPEVLYVDRVEAGWPLRMTLEQGSRVPMHCTASGKLFLARMAPRPRRRLVESLPLTALTPRTITTRKALEAELGRIAKLGYSTDNEEFIVGLIAVAVPVVGSDGRVLGAVACHAPEARLSLAAALKHLPRLRQAATALARTLK